MAAIEFSPQYRPENATIAPGERNLGKIYEKPMANRLCARIGGMGTGTIIRHSLFWFGKNRNFLGAGCKSGFRINTPRSFSERREAFAMPSGIAFATPLARRLLAKLSSFCRAKFGPAGSNGRCRSSSSSRLYSRVDTSVRCQQASVQFCQGGC
jgi:hypothetical protein